MKLLLTTTRAWHILSIFLGFLIGLVKHLTRHHARTVSCDADTQTDMTTSSGESLGTTGWCFVLLYTCAFLCSVLIIILFVSTAEKMKSIDREYENVSSSGDKWSSMESKLAAYRKEIEVQAQAEMNTKVFSTTDLVVKGHFKWFIIQMLRFCWCFLFF